MAWPVYETLRVACFHGVVRLPLSYNELFITLLHCVFVALTIKFTFAVSIQGCTFSQQPPAAKRARMTDPVGANPQPLQQPIHRRVTAGHLMQLL
jgi:hypothetical protein